MITFFCFVAIVILQCKEQLSDLSCRQNEKIEYTSQSVIFANAQTLAAAIQTLEAKAATKNTKNGPCGMERSSKSTKDTNWFCYARAFAPLLLRSASANIFARVPQESAPYLLPTGRWRRSPAGRAQRCCAEGRSSRGAKARAPRFSVFPFVSFVAALFFFLVSEWQRCRRTWTHQDNATLGRAMQRDQITLWFS